MRILFYARKNYQNENGEVSIMVRVTMNGTSSQFSSGISNNLDLWYIKKRIVGGNSEYAKNVSERLIDIEMTLKSIAMIRRGLNR